MGQKANSNLLRVTLDGEFGGWCANWFDQGNYAANVLADFHIRRRLEREFKRLGVASIVIRRNSGTVDCVLKVSRPGMVTGGRSGSGAVDLDFVKREFEKEFGGRFSFSFVEVGNPDLNAKMLGEWIAAQLEKRVPFRRAIKMALQRCMKAGSKGCRIGVAGRLDGKDIARSETVRDGKVPLHTFRANVKFSKAEAHTTFGIVGVKVWIYTGDF